MGTMGVTTFARGVTNGFGGESAGGMFDDDMEGGAGMDIEDKLNAE